MYHNVIGRSVLLEVGALENADLSRTVCQLVVVAGDADGLFHLARRRCAHDVQVVQPPGRGDIQQLNAHTLRPRRRRIHEHHRPVEKAMVAAKLRAKRPPAVEVYIVLDYGTAPRSRNLPLAGLALDDRNLSARSIRGADVLHIGCKIANLVQRVPCRHVERDGPGRLRKSDADMREVTGAVGE